MKKANIINNLNSENSISQIENQRIQYIGINTKDECESIIGINTKDGTLIFNPFEIKINNNKNTFCKALKKSYPNGSNKIIPLSSTKKVKF